MATLQYPDGTVKDVKNLGWLLRHWKDVKDFEIIEGRPRLGWRPEALLIVHMKPGFTYVTDYASMDALWSFLQRPVFYDLPGTWKGVPFIVTKGAKRPAAAL